MPDLEIESVKSIEDEFKRNGRYVNDCGLSEDQLVRRKHQVEELRKMYPTICPSWIELAWNYCEITPEEEIKAKRESGYYDQKPERERLNGGLVKNAFNIESRE